MFRTVRKLPPPERLKRIVPLTGEAIHNRENAIRRIRDILDGKDKRKLFVVGPCSADDADAVCDYAVRLAAIADKVKDKIFTVMRVYTAKTRTRGDGYLGLLHSISVNGNIDLAAGLAAARELHIRVMRESGLCIADEIVYADTVDYLSDTLCYATVGARTSDDPTHRFVASGLDIPVGIKNPVNGNPHELAGSLCAATSPNCFVFRGEQVQTDGNPYAHAVFRGAVDKNGAHIPNYGRDDVLRFADMCAERGVKGAVIDAGHSNSGKNAKRQMTAVEDVLNMAARCPEYNAFVKGIMLESYIVDGNQSVGGVYGKSVTDECLGIEMTERSMLSAAERIIL